MLLISKAESFVNELNATFSAIWGKTPFRWKQAKKGLCVTSGEEPFKLSKGKTRSPLFGEFEYFVDLSEDQKHLSVQKSCFSFTFDGESNPLFRYEFNKRYETLPRSHFHIHLNPEDPAYNPQSSRRKILQSIHFPLGGDLLRPCLEDVILACDNDFNLKLSRDDRDVLKDAVLSFRIIQAITVVKKYRRYLFSDGLDLDSLIVYPSKSTEHEP